MKNLPQMTHMNTDVLKAYWNGSRIDFSGGGAADDERWAVDREWDGTCCPPNFELGGELGALERVAERLPPVELVFEDDPASVSADKRSGVVVKTPEIK